MDAKEEQPPTPVSRAKNRYRVGFGKPPKHSQFKKGESGNPHGRPKGKPNVGTVILRALEAKVLITENGRRRTVTKFEAAAIQLINKAASGDLKAVDQVIRLRALAEGSLDRDTPLSSVLHEADDKVLEGLMARIASTERGTGERGQ